MHWPAGREPNTRLVDIRVAICGFAKIVRTARAAGAGEGVLSGSLAAAAVQGVLLAAGALGLGGTDAGAILGGLAAGGSGVDHCGGWFVLVLVVESGFEMWEC